MSFLKKRRSSAGGDGSNKPKGEARGSQCQYEVFLSFRGEDTRYSFVDILYENLKDAGVIVFRDEEGLPKGETIHPELLNAIQQSSISIPIFSEGYAHSKWCLWELDEMLKCSKARGRKILPVFYYVKPRNVRNQAESYEQAFQKHSENFSNETVNAWKEDLREVGAINGWEVENTADGRQGKIIQSIVKHVLRELKKGYLNVTNYLVGIEHHVKAILKLLNADSSSSTDIVGIYGIGGIGKTTLAKVVYNHLHDSFEYHSFLESIREKELGSLQIQLISSILKQKDVSIFNLDEGIKMIKERFCHKRVLILLDDVDDQEQLKKLAGSHDWFGIGSKIIVTTRNQEVLCKHEVKPYELEELNFTQSCKLFSKHALRAEEPPKDYLAFVEQFVFIVNGLPLALEVLGSSLCGENKSEWERRLRKLEGKPLEEVAAKLKITYDTLSHEEQQIFLDIACHFIGMDIRIAIHFWCSFNYYYNYVEESLQTLVDKCLVKLGDKFEIKMHDQLRDLGRAIVYKKSIAEENTVSRVWNYEEAWDIISKKRGTDNIKGLDLGPLFSFGPGKQESLYDEQFTKLTKLRFLRVGYAKFDGDFHQLLPQLKWLIWAAGWGGREDRVIDAPRNFNLENLVILDLSWSKVTESWDGWSQIKGENLRVLNLTRCAYLTRSPNLSSYTNLERLIFGYCYKLVEIDKSIGKLKSLTFLDLRGCSHLEMLPPELEFLNALEELLIDHVSIEKLPPLEGMNELKVLGVQQPNLGDFYPFGRLKDVSSIGHLTSLKDLALDYSNITNLPSSIGLLVNLESLSLRFCKYLCGLPETIENLKSLRKLFLGSSSIVDLPQAILRLLHLRTLDLAKCAQLQSVVALPLNLIDFRFNWEGSNLIFPDSINLRELCFTNEPEVAQWVSLAELIGLYFSKLEELDFSNAEVTTLLVEFSIFKQLKKLFIRKCEQLPCISELPSSLSCLYIDCCPSLEKIPNLSSLSTLQTLSITRCKRLKEIRGLEGLEVLQQLNVPYCSELCILDGIEQLESLELLDISQCLGLPDISSLEKLKICNDVKISGSVELQKVDSNVSLHSNTLTTLTISGLDIMFLPKNLFSFNCLRELKLDGLHSLKALPTLPQSLVSLQVMCCSGLTDWPDMSNLKNLSKLVICWTILREIQGLGELKSLAYLEIKMCQNLTTLVGLEELVSLERLKLDCCTSLQVIPNLSNLKKLEVVRATNCISLVGIEGLEGLNLKEFTFYANSPANSYNFDEWGSTKCLSEAAMKLQKVYRSFRTRRELADRLVLVEQSEWKLLDFAELKSSSVSFFDIEEHETAISRWSRARTRASNVGKDLSKNGQAQKLDLQLWLEAIDPRHRYGRNLHFYYEEWSYCQSREPFFHWLDVGEGKEVNLENCSRSRLKQQCIKYLDPTEREVYEVVVKDGKFFYKQTGELLHTVGEKMEKWIFVLSASKILYVGKKKKGIFHHSSFLAGGPAIAAGRLYVDNGILKAAWPYSSYYRTTEENFMDFQYFLGENYVHLTDIKGCSYGPDDVEDWLFPF